MRPLTRFAIIAEQPDSCAQRLLAAGRHLDVAKEVSFYLDQASNLEVYRDAIDRAFAAYGVACRIFDPAKDLGWLDWVRSEPSSSMVWNMTDGFAYFLGSAVPAAARLAGIATFGSPATAQALAQDKFAISALGRSLGLATLPMALARGETWITEAPEFSGPYFVKPATLGAKIGIWPESRCQTVSQALGLSARIAERFGDDAIVQPFLPGEDVRVSYLDIGGDPDLERLGIYKLDARDADDFMTGDESMSVSGHSRLIPTLVRFEHVGITDAVRRFAGALRLQDVFSFDFRLAADGRAWLLECEVCPAVTIYDFRRYLADAWNCDLPEALARSVMRCWATKGALRTLR